MLRVAAYARVSTDKEDQINSLTNQREYFESYIKSKDDWEFVEVYFDEGITGTQTKKRKGFNRMINDCKNGKIDLILTKEVSRFARNTVDTLNYTVVKHILDIYKTAVKNRLYKIIRVMKMKYAVLIALTIGTDVKS